jgi:peptidoglycan/LPS O-acetylase OafA/YrhL
MHSTKYQWLDLVRGVSALLVCANHLRAVMFVDFSSANQESLLVKLFYFLTGLGGQSVVVFFVLSGFFVGGSVLKRWQNFSYRDYLLARVTRLWLVLVPALLATFLIDQFTFALYPELLAGSDFGKIHSGPRGDYSTSFSTLLQNLIFLQTITAPVFGSNGPLWSLSNEFWYYLYFPLLVLLFTRAKERRMQLIVIALAAVFGAVFLQDKALGFIVWTFGTLAYCCPTENRFMRPKMLVAIALLLFTYALVASKRQWLSAGQDMLVLGFGSGCLIVALRGLQPMPRFFGKATEYLSRASYSLYLVHFPLVLLIYAGFFCTGQVTLTAGTFSAFVGFLCIFLLVAQGFWLAFEKHTNTVKSYLTSLLGKGRANSVSSEPGNAGHGQ